MIDQLSNPRIEAEARVLLVEDDCDVRRVLVKLLRHAGYDVVEAEDGREGLAAIERERPSVIITDCEMPRMNGPELLEHLARDSRYCSIPAIVLSGTDPPPLPKSAVAFLAKPIESEQFLSAVRSCFVGPMIDTMDSVDPIDG
jgi:CheY-like chemotaxis protein